MVFKHREGESKPKVRKKDDPTQRMRQKFDTPFGRELYSKRMGTVEPVFAMEALHDGAQLGEDIPERLHGVSGVALGGRSGRVGGRFTEKRRRIGFAETCCA
jgi:hypothetical protein